VACHRCTTLCPTSALDVAERPRAYRANANWQPERIEAVHRQGETGGVLLGSMGCDRDYPVFFDHLLLNASQVTNPSIDPLREPMELRTFLGAKPERLRVATRGDEILLTTILPPQVQIEVPIIFSAMSYGSIGLNACKALAAAAAATGTLFNTGEGGMHADLRPSAGHSIVQVASGRFGVDSAYLQAGRIIEIKIGQGAKPGIGGHLPAAKVVGDISATRMIPVGTDAISPAPHHDIYSIEDLRQLIEALKEATAYQKPIAVKIAAVHNVAAIASGIARAGADLIAIDGLRGGTGAAPLCIRDNVGIPVELAIAVVDQRLRDERLRHRVSLLAAGGIRCSGDVVKAIALGADAVYIGTAALVAMGCHLCQQCSTDKCSWGIATQDPYLVRRLNPELGAQRLINLIGAWSHEIQELLGGMGLNSLEGLRGNRLHLRGIGMSREDLEILGVKSAGVGM